MQTTCRNHGKGIKPIIDDGGMEFSVLRGQTPGISDTQAAATLPDNGGA